MDLLVRLCHKLSGTQFLGSGDAAVTASAVGSLDAADERAIIMPRQSSASAVSPILGRVCWLVFDCAHRVMRDAEQRYASASARNHARQQTRYLRDFFTLPVEQFIGRFADDLSRLPFQSRSLVIAVKYRLTCTLERDCPPSLSAITVDDAPGDARPGASEFARCYYTVASVVPCTDDDYRALLSGNLYGCSCARNREGGRSGGDRRGGGVSAESGARCQFCLRAKLYRRGGGADRPVTMLDSADSRRVDPYEPPNPYAWMKLHAGEDSESRRDDGGGGRGCWKGNGDDLVNRFRRQTVQKDVYETWRRGQHSGGRASAPYKRDPINKFRPSALPRSLRPRARKHHQPLDEGLYERDLGTLLSHFTIDWAKLHYLEPAIFPQYSD